MPFKSEKQRRYLWANEPEIARDWSDTYGSKIQKAKGGRIGLQRGMSPGAAQARGLGAQHHGSTTSWGSTQQNVGGEGGQGFVPGIGTVKAPPKKTITKDVRPTKQITRYINPRGMRNTGFVNQGNFPQRNWRNFGIQAIMNMPKYWSLPSDIRRLYEAGENIPIAHGFETEKIKKAIKKGGFKNIRPKTKLVPTTDAIEAATKALLKGNVKDAYTKLGQTKGAFTAIGPTEKAAFLGGQKYAKPGGFFKEIKTGLRGVGDLGSAKKVVSGSIDPKFGYIDRGMTGNLQGRWNTGAVNKALGLGSKSAQVAGKPIAQSLLNKIGARALPGANIALGGAAALGHLQAGNYGQAAMAGLSMAPGPLGWAGLAGEMGLGALSNLSLGDPNALENTLVMKEGGIARLPFAKGGRRDIEGSGYYDAPQGRQELRSMQANINQAQRNGGYNWGAKGEDPVVISSKDLEFINQRDGKSKQWTWDRTSLMNQKTRDIIKMLRLETPKMGYYDRYTFPSGFYEEQEDGEFTSGYLKGPATWGINPAWTGEGPDIRKYPYAKGGLATLWPK